MAATSAVSCDVVMSTPNAGGSARESSNDGGFGATMDDAVREASSAADDAVNAEPAPIDSTSETADAGGTALPEESAAYAAADESIAGDAPSTAGIADVDPSGTVALAVLPPSNAAAADEASTAAATSAGSDIGAATSSVPFVPDAIDAVASTDAGAAAQTIETSSALVGSNVADATAKMEAAANAAPTIASEAQSRGKPRSAPAGTTPTLTDALQLDDMPTALDATTPADTAAQSASDPAFTNVLGGATVEAATPLVERAEAQQPAQTATRADAAAGAAEIGSRASAPQRTSVMTDLLAQLQPSGMAEQMGQRMLWMQQMGVQLARLQVHPSDLGPIDIALDQRDGAISVSMSAHHPATRDLLEQHQARIREQLEAQGTVVHSFDVLDGGTGRRDAEDHGSDDPDRHAQAEAGAEIERAPAIRLPLHALGLFEAYA